MLLGAAFWNTSDVAAVALTYALSHTHTHTCTRTRTRTRARHTHTHTHAYARARAHTHTHSHTHAHAHAHAREQALFLRDVAPELQAGVILRASKLMQSYLDTLSVPHMSYALPKMYPVYQV